MTRLPPRLRRIVLHVGPSKTGTTTLQHDMSDYRNEFRARGICYPDPTPPGREGQHSFAWDILRETGRPAFETARMRLSWPQAFATAHACAHTLVVSSEAFSDFEADSMAHPRAVPRDLPLTLIFALRDPARVIASAWRHSVKWGFAAGEETPDLKPATRLLATSDRVAAAPFLDRALTLLRAERPTLPAVPPVGIARRVGVAAARGI